MMFQLQYTLKLKAVLLTTAIRVEDNIEQNSVTV